MSHERPIPDAALAPYPPQPSARPETIPVAASTPAAQPDRTPASAAAMWIAAGVGSAAVFAAALYATRQARKK